MEATGYIYYIYDDEYIYIGQATDTDYRRLKQHLQAAYKEDYRDASIPIFQRSGARGGATRTVIFEAPNYGFSNFEELFNEFSRNWTWSKTGKATAANAALDFAEMAHILYHYTRSGGRKVLNRQFGGANTWTYNLQNVLDRIWDVCGFEGSVAAEKKQLTIHPFSNNINLIAKVLSPLTYYIVRGITQGINSKIFGKDLNVDSVVRQEWVSIFTDPQVMKAMFGHTPVKSAKPLILPKIIDFFQREWNAAWQQIRASNILDEFDPATIDNLQYKTIDLNKLYKLSPEFDRSLAAYAANLKKRTTTLGANKIISRSTLTRWLNMALAARKKGNSKLANELGYKVSRLLMIKLQGAGRGQSRIDPNEGTRKSFINSIEIDSSWITGTINTKRNLKLVPEWYYKLMRGPQGWAAKKEPATVTTVYMEESKSQFKKIVDKIGPGLTDLIADVSTTGKKEDFNAAVGSHMAIPGRLKTTDGQIYEGYRMWYLSSNDWLGSRLRAEYEKKHLAFIVQHWDEFYTPMISNTITTLHKPTILVDAINYNHETTRYYIRELQSNINGLTYLFYRSKAVSATNSAIKIF